MPFEVHITRAINGWIARLPAEPAIEAPEQTFVFNDQNEIVADEYMAMAQSLQEALQTVFPDWMRSKHRAGLVIEVKPSHSEEEAREHLQER